MGTDDGLVWRSVDDGEHWRHVTPNTWRLVEGRRHRTRPTSTPVAYLAVDRHRLDDNGRTSTARRRRRHLDGDRRRDSRRRLRQRRARGPRAAWPALRRYRTRHLCIVRRRRSMADATAMNLPVTSVRDIDVHGNDLVIATHGRGFWITRRHFAAAAAQRRRSPPPMRGCSRPPPRYACAVRVSRHADAGRRADGGQPAERRLSSTTR